MTKGFIKLQRTSELMNTDPNAFLILSTVARLQGRDGTPARITPRLFPTMTRKQYREAISRLEKGPSNVPLGAFKGHTKFTEGVLLTRDVYDINETGATKGPSKPETGATEQEVDLKNKEKRPGRFVPPSVPEVLAYFTDEKSFPSQAEAENFVEFYESKGWKVGKNSMVKWKAAASRWIKGKESPEPSKPRNFWHFDDEHLVKLAQQHGLNTAGLSRQDLILDLQRNRVEVPA